MNFLFADCHSCLPLRPDTDINQLRLHHRAGCRYLSLNIGMDLNPLSQIISTLASFRRQIAESDFLLQVESSADIERAFREDKLAVAFDLEGGIPLLENPDTLALYHRLGLRQIHLAYNRNNALAGGCHDPEIQGLTPLGEQVVREIHRLGILMDLSHNSEQTAHEICALSRDLGKPVLYSHANPSALVEHGRNISDRIIAEVAASGGVIGINGVARFANNEDLDPLALLPLLEHSVEIAGIEHTAIGLDYCYDDGISDMPSNLDTAYWWPRAAGYGAKGLGGKYLAPDKISILAEALLRMNYREDDVESILRKNILRLINEIY